MASAAGYGVVAEAQGAVWLDVATRKEPRQEGVLVGNWSAPPLGEGPPGGPTTWPALE
jgi:hypothetical protein